MSNSIIRAALETTLLNWAAAQNPVIPVAKENSSFTKPTSGVFLECFVLPSNVINPTIDGIRKRYLGIFQVNVWVPSGGGSMTATSVAQNIVDLFPVIPKGVVSIEKTPSIEKSLLDTSGWFVTPVTIQYRFES